MGNLIKTFPSGFGSICHIHTEIYTDTHAHTMPHTHYDDTPTQTHIIVLSFSLSLYLSIYPSSSHNFKAKLFRLSSEMLNNIFGV